MTNSKQAPLSPIAIDRFSTTSEDEFLVNSFLIKSDHGVIVIDTQFLVSPAEALRNRVQETGLPLQAVIITHPHPDHFGGTAILLQGHSGVPVYATQPTLDGIKAIEASKREFWTPIYKDEYPPSTYLPGRVVESGKPFTIDGVEFIIDDLGASESANAVVIYLPKTRALIASDLVYNKIHPWLAEGRSATWLGQLELVKTRYADAVAVFAGHGAPGTLSLLDEQTDYIRILRALVQKAVMNGKVPEAAKSAIVEKMKALYPDFSMANLIALGVDGVATEFV